MKGNVVLAAARSLVPQSLPGRYLRLLTGIDFLRNMLYDMLPRTHLYPVFTDDRRDL